MNVSQIVYISNRPGILNDTLRQVKSFVSFITDVVIISPANIKDQFTNPGFSSFHIVSDESLNLPDLKDELTKHSFINYHLRREAMKSELIHDVFIMSDDDYRPIVPIDLSFFVNKDKYNSYYFYNLKYWMQSQHSYDHCLLNTLIALQSAQLKTYAFSSHMPQIIDKGIYIECTNFFKDISENYGLCEWSTYFNYAINKYPDRFNSPDIYQTMCWPQTPGIWPTYIVPEEYSFENIYEENYRDKTALFFGLNPSTNISNYKEMNFEKLRRLRLVHIRHSFPPPMADWVKPSLARRIKNWFLKTIFKIDHERFIHDRAILLEMHAKNNLNK